MSITSNRVFHINICLCQTDLHAESAISEEQNGYNEEEAKNPKEGKIICVSYFKQIYHRLLRKAVTRLLVIEGNKHTMFSTTTFSKKIIRPDYF